MVPDGTRVQSAQYDSGILSTFSQQEIENGFASTVGTRDIIIDNVTYHIYTNINRGLTNSGALGQVTIN